MMIIAAVVMKFAAAETLRVLYAYVYACLHNQLYDIPLKGSPSVALRLLPSAICAN